MSNDARRRLSWLAAGSCAGLLMMATSGCVLTTEHDGTSAVSATTGGGAIAGRDPAVFARPGTGWFSFDDPVLASPVRIAYSVPPEPQNAHVLIVMPGTQRNADDYLADWLGSGVARSTIVLVPQLPRAQFTE